MCASHPPSKGTAAVSLSRPRGHAAATPGCIYPRESVFPSALGRQPGGGLLDRREALFLTFWGASMLLSRVAAPVCVPTSGEWGSLFSTACPTLVVTCLVGGSASNRCGLVCHSGFELRSGGGAGSGGRGRQMPSELLPSLRGPGAASLPRQPSSRQSRPGVPGPTACPAPPRTPGK